MLALAPRGEGMPQKYSRYKGVQMPHAPEKKVVIAVFYSGFMKTGVVERN